MPELSCSGVLLFMNGSLVVQKCTELQLGCVFLHSLYVYYFYNIL